MKLSQILQEGIQSRTKRNRSTTTAWVVYDSQAEEFASKSGYWATTPNFQWAFIYHKQKTAETRAAEMNDLPGSDHAMQVQPIRVIYEL